MAKITSFIYFPMLIQNKYIKSTQKPLGFDRDRTFNKIIKKQINLVAVSEINFFHRNQANNLPDDSEHKVWSPIQESLRINSDDSDMTLGSIEELS